LPYSDRTEIPRARTRKLTIVAQDPAITGRDGRILTAEVDVPAEELARGPLGYRVHVIDYDGSTRTLYARSSTGPGHGYRDPFRNPSNATILNNPQFHAQNVDAIVMRTLARFEFALGRRVSWGFRGHQIKVASWLRGRERVLFRGRSGADVRLLPGPQEPGVCLPVARRGRPRNHPCAHRPASADGSPIRRHPIRRPFTKASRTSSRSCRSFRSATSWKRCSTATSRHARNALGKKVHGPRRRSDTGGPAAVAAVRPGKRDATVEQTSTPWCRARYKSFD
jgi:hypothetical protein